MVERPWAVKYWFGSDVDQRYEVRGLPKPASTATQGFGRQQRARQAQRGGDGERGRIQVEWRVHVVAVVGDVGGGPSRRRFTRCQRLRPSRRWNRATGAHGAKRCVSGSR